MAPEPGVPDSPGEGLRSISESENELRMPPDGASQPVSARQPFATAVTLAAWIVPGLGHLLLRRWGRAIVVFAAVGGLAMSGYLMRGEVFAPRSPEPLGMLGFLADAASGIFYLLSRFCEAAGPDVSRSAGDYGTQFIAAAGVVNLISLFDAYELAVGRRT